MLVRRQLGSKQLVPATHGLSELEFNYNDKGAEKLKKEVVKAWKSVCRVKSGTYTDSVVPGYETWHAKRGKGLREPAVYGPDLPIKMDAEPHDVKEEMRHRYEFVCQEMRANDVALKKENSRLKEELDKANKKMKKMKRYIQGIPDASKLIKKDDQQRKTIQKLRAQAQRFEGMTRALQADLNNQIGRRSEARREAESLQALVDSLKTKSKGMAQENHKLQIKVHRLEQELQEQKTATRVELFRYGQLRFHCQVFEQRTQDLVAAFRDMARRARDLADMVNDFRRPIIPGDAERQELIHFLDHVYGELNHAGKYH